MENAQKPHPARNQGVKSGYSARIDLPTISVEEQTEQNYVAQEVGSVQIQLQHLQYTKS